MKRQYDNWFPPYRAPPCDSERIDLCHVFVPYLDNAIACCGHDGIQGEVYCDVCLLCSSCCADKSREEMARWEKKKKRQKQPNREMHYPLLPRIVWLELIFPILEHFELLSLGSTCFSLYNLATIGIQRMLLRKFGFETKLTPDKSIETRAFLASALGPVRCFSFGVGKSFFSYVFGGMFSRENGLYNPSKELVLKVLDDTWAGSFAVLAPEILDIAVEISERLRSGRTFILDGDFIRCLQHLLPSGLWHAERGRCKFVAGREQHNWLNANLFAQRKVLVYDCDAAHVNFQLISDDCAECFICEKLMLQIGLMHSTIASRVDYYKSLFLNDSSYAPTILLLSPNFKQYGYFEDIGPVGLFGRAAIVIDGHHKLKAAVELERDVQFVFIDTRPNESLLKYRSFQHFSTVKRSTE